MDKAERVAEILDDLIYALLENADALDLPVNLLMQLRAELAEVPKIGSA